MKNKRLLLTFIGFDIIVAIGILGWFAWLKPQPIPAVLFDGERALNDVINQVKFGPRIPDSQAHKNTINYIQLELKKAGWQATLLEQNINGHIAYNILATRNFTNPVLLLGAHYDSRIYADNDPDPNNHTTPVPGANDGASGVAVLLELARNLPSDGVSTALLFIDIEDNGRISGWDWIQGSQALASKMNIQPKAVVIIDMIGDADLNIFMEKNSDTEITNQLWKTAKKLGYESTFIPEYKYRVLDDHVPFIEMGIQAVDIIDLDYPFWHTIQDTPDKVSATSLEKIGYTLLAWIHDYGPCIKLQNCSMQ